MYFLCKCIISIVVPVLKPIPVASIPDHVSVEFTERGDSELDTGTHFVVDKW